MADDSVADRRTFLSISHMGISKQEIERLIIRCFIYRRCLFLSFLCYLLTNNVVKK